jgi:hypothetical protein
MQSQQLIEIAECNNRDEKDEETKIRRNKEFKNRVEEIKIKNMTCAIKIDYKHQKVLKVAKLPVKARKVPKAPKAPKA